MNLVNGEDVEKLLCERKEEHTKNELKRSPRNATDERLGERM